MKQTLIKTRRVVVTFFFLSFLNNPYRSYRGLIGVLCEVGEGEKGGEGAPPEHGSEPASIPATYR